MTVGYLSEMTTFAAAASISPGPVNTVAFSSGARYGFGRSLRHIAGASVGFAILLMAVGTSVEHTGFATSKVLFALKWAGVAFLLYVSYKMIDDGDLPAYSEEHRFSFFEGAKMQWLNPKAWFASVIGAVAFTRDRSAFVLFEFSVIYLAVSFVATATWCASGAIITRGICHAGHFKAANMTVATALLLSAVYFAISNG
jgi:threonine/homoserine/homoserine lactone efflux protein